MAGTRQLIGRYGKQPVNVNFAELTSTIQRHITRVGNAVGAGPSSSKVTDPMAADQCRLVYGKQPQSVPGKAPTEAKPPAKKTPHVPTAAEVEATSRWWLATVLKSPFTSQNLQPTPQTTAPQSQATTIFGFSNSPSTQKSTAVEPPKSAFFGKPALSSAQQKVEAAMDLTSMRSSASASPSKRKIDTAGAQTNLAKRPKKVEFIVIDDD